MKNEHFSIHSSITDFWETLPENERVIVDYLRRLVLKVLPEGSREKMSFGVPNFYIKKWICIIWPASVNGGGIKTGVLFGFTQGNKLKDTDNYLVHGTNKKIFYRIYNSLEEIEEVPLIKLLHEAIELDSRI